ncbi:MAG: hypothetical protein AB3N13_10795 [Arenibacterium sp.]
MSLASVLVGRGLPRDKEFETDFRYQGSDYLIEYYHGLFGGIPADAPASINGVRIEYPLFEDTIISVAAFGRWSDLRGNEENARKIVIAFCKSRLGRNLKPDVEGQLTGDEGSEFWRFVGPCQPRK